MINDIRILQGAQALNELQKRQLMPKGEIAVLAQNLKGEEGIAIADVIKRALNTFTAMPHTYQTEDQEDPTAHLHYFVGSWDWYITEKDCRLDQVQAFGLTKSIACPDGELGYINLEQITGVGAELDLYFSPAPLSYFGFKL